ncbi:MAG: response regulator, partial [Bacteroidota bacterium]
EGDTFILIIEDDPKFTRILYDMAGENGFKALIAHDGETGIHYADYYNPAAIILDVMLPGIDGWEVMTRLKNNLKTRHIPVHFVSATDKSLRAMKMGAIGYLTKPVTTEQLDKLFQKISDVINREEKKLLVIDDEAIVRKSVEGLIGKSGVMIKSIGSGREAFKMLKEEVFDLVILDLGLEDMSGFDLLEMIKKEKTIPQIPVIVYTGQELTHEEEHLLKRYAQSIIIKGARSPERLLAETTLFLHKQEKELPEKQQEKLQHIVAEKQAIVKNKHILLADDDMRNLFALSSVLESHGMKITMARNGKEALKKLEAARPPVDLVLMDIMMPEMDGYEAIRRIRKMEKFEDLPVIALTAKAMKNDREKTITAGASDYLAKPIDNEKLISMLRVWLYNNQ